MIEMLSVYLILYIWFPDEAVSVIFERGTHACWRGTAHPNAPVNATALAEDTADSLLSCARLCAQSAPCLRFTYNRPNKQCALFSGYASDPPPANSNDCFGVTPIVECFNGGTAHYQKCKCRFAYEGASCQTKKPDPCFKCICHALGCQPQVGACQAGAACGPFRITNPYWTDCGQPGASFAACASDYTCSEACAKAYMARYMTTCDSAASPTCRHYAMMHSVGPWGCGSPNQAFLNLVYNCCNGQTGCD